MLDFAEQRARQQRRRNQLHPYLKLYMFLRRSMKNLTPTHRIANANLMVESL